MYEMKKIFEDKRGEMYAIPLTDNKDILIYTTNKGYARGGGYHMRDDEFFIVIKGTVNFLIGERWATYREGGSGVVPKNYPHMMIAEEDCIMMEWGADREDKNHYHNDYRKHVESLNKVRENADKTG